MRGVEAQTEGNSLVDALDCEIGVPAHVMGVGGSALPLGASTDV